VVKNEKKSYDNRPMDTLSVISKNLYPETHPQLGGNWFTRRFTKCYFGRCKSFTIAGKVPNNVTLTIAGDFDVNQTKIWVEKILGEITRSSYSKKWKTPVTLNETKNYITKIIFSLYRNSHFGPVCE
jgi:zinc protease